MKGIEGSRGILRASAVAAALAWLPATAVAGEGARGDAPKLKAVRLDDPEGRMAVRFAIEGARKWLARPACREVFSEFADAEGRPLSAALEELGETAENHLEGLVFYEGTGSTRCRSSAVAAYTVPKALIVWVCPIEFQRFDAFSRRAILIHEQLHSLGLADDLPASTLITQRVHDRCSGAARAERSTR